MRKQAFQPGEIRDEQNNIIRPGAYGKNSAFATAANDGILDYIINNFDALYDTLTGGMLYVDSLPESGDASKLYVIKSNGECYRYDGAKFVLMDGAAVDFISNAKLAEDGTMTLTTAAGRSLSVPLDPVNAIADKAQKSADAAKASETASRDWAVSETSPDGATDTDSSTGKTQSSRNWALESKANAQSASSSASIATSQASSASTSATNAKSAMNTANTAASSASTSATNASTSASNAAKAEVAAKTAQAEAEKARNDANSAVTKLTGVMKYAGQVDNYRDLADVTKNKGDVWNIVNADSEHGIKAGDNVAWNGTDWDDLSGTVDLSIYAEKADYQKAITSATADGATITFNHKDGTTSTATVNNVASAIAATNDAKGQKIDATYEKIADASNVHTSLQNSINTKLDKTGTAVSATKLSTARTISLTGNATGAATFDGSGDISINTTVNESKHAAAADTATKATQDASGNVITDTYAKKTDVTVKGVKVDGATSPLVPDSSGVVTIPKTDLSNYYTKTQVDSAISTAVSAIVDGDNKSY